MTTLTFKSKWEIVTLTTLTTQFYNNYIHRYFLQEVQRSLTFFTNHKCWLPVNEELELLSISSVKTSGRHYTFPESELKDTQKQFTENLWIWKHSLMQLPIEICSSTSNSLIIIGNFWKHLTLIKHIKDSFFVLYKIIPGYFNELIYEIMKWNISKIKHRSYEALNLQVYLIVLAFTLENL